MNRLLWLFALGLLVSAPSPGAECLAARAMASGTGELEQRKNLLQRREWLLLEFLSTDGAKKSRKLFEAEVAKSRERTAAMLAQFEKLEALPPDTPAVPEDGTPACATLTDVKTAVDNVLDAREKELAELTGQRFPFVKACDEMGVQLVNLAAGARKPGTEAKTVSLLRLTLDIALGPQIHQSRMGAAAFDALVEEVFAPNSLPPRAVAGYGSLRCLRTYQRADIKTLAEATPALALCSQSSWLELGQCVEQATRRQ